MNAVLADHIFRSGDIITLWPIQVMQDALSLHANIPLRIWSQRRAEKAENVIPLLPELMHKVSQNSFFDNLTKEIVSHYGYRSGSGWLTRPSNAHPLIANIRRSPVWIAWEQVLLRTLTKPGLSEEPQAHFLYFRYPLRICLFPFKVHDIQKYLVVGPVIVAAEDRMKNSSLSDLVRDFCTSIAELSSKLHAEGLLDKRRLSPRRWTKEDLTLLAISTGWVTEKCFERTCVRVGNTMDAILNVNWELGKDDIVSNTAYNAIAQVAYMLHSSDFTDERSRLTSVSFKRQFPHLFMVGLPKTNEKLTKARNHALRVTCGERPTGPWKLALCAYEGKEGEGPPSKAWIEPDSNGVKDEEYDLDLKFMRGDLGLNFAVRYHAHIAKQLADLSEWINDKLGVISSRLGPDGRKVTKDEAYDAIVKKISDIFIADVVTLYLYGFRENEPHPLGGYRRKRLKMAAMYVETPPDEREKRANWKNDECKAMEKVGEEEDRAKTSISYRAVEKKTGRFCKAAWPVERQGVIEWVFDPPEEKVLTPDAHSSFKGKSVISIPLTVYDRPMGVLEINGLHPYQFRMGSQLLAQRVADMITPFVYEREALSRLLSLSDFVMDRNKDEKERYEEICRTMVEIFLADGGILFLPSVDEYQKYDLVGNHNIKDLNYQDDKPEELSEVMVGQRWLDEEDRELGFSYSIAEQVENNPKWPESMKHRLAIYEQFPLGHAVVVRVMDRSGLWLLCRFSLYYCRGNPLDTSWLPTIRFVSRYLVMLIMASKRLTSDLDEEGLANAFRKQGKDPVVRLKSVHERLSKIRSRVLANRNTGDGDENATADLQKRFKEGRLVLVLGAGVSKDYGLDWKTLLKKLLSTALVGNKKDGDTAEVISKILTAFLPQDPLVSASYVLNSFKDRHEGRAAFVQRVLYDSIRGKKSTQLVNAIKNLCLPMRGQKPLLDCIITYNYDDIVEDRLDQRDTKVPFKPVNDGDIQITEDILPIYHVHGYLPSQTRWTAKESDPLVLGEEDYEQLWIKPHAWKNLVQTGKFMEKTCLFVGFSFKDPNVRRLMHGLSWNNKSRGLRHYCLFEKMDRKRMKQDVRDMLVLRGVFSSVKNPHEAKEVWRLLADISELVCSIWEEVQDQDLDRLGVQTIRLDSYKRVPGWLDKIWKTARPAEAD